ncbi:hypothetical protein KFL_005610050 [Klebsormidium nitens]|uniref:Uncharacterized protein n=1 Tax=Klebsormidium nitens TaxID=105231 RepID=A0A1Y1INU0_KLENI|nr:hypothetical protein KFL_005610050 [Klebsormidium nitens]|eukprot:GAQ89778.1 hypothetical protein KFL_005610050 [Klebsormidium nitens]
MKAEWQESTEQGAGASSKEKSCSASREPVGKGQVEESTVQDVNAQPAAKEDSKQRKDDKVSAGGVIQADDLFSHMVHSGAYEEIIGKPAVRTLRRWYKDLKDRIENALDGLTNERLKGMNFKVRREDVEWRESLFKETMDDTDGGVLLVKGDRSYKWPAESFNRTFSQIVEQLKKVKLHPERYAAQQAKKATKYKASKKQNDMGDEGVRHQSSKSRDSAASNRTEGMQVASCEEGAIGQGNEQVEESAQSRCVMSFCSVNTGRPVHMCHVCQKPVHNLCLQKMMNDLFGVKEYDGENFFCEAHAASSGLTKVGGSREATSFTPASKASGSAPVWEAAVPTATPAADHPPSGLSGSPESKSEKQAEPNKGLEEQPQRDAKGSLHVPKERNEEKGSGKGKRIREERTEESGSGKGKGGDKSSKKKSKSDGPSTKPSKPKENQNGKNSEIERENADSRKDETKSRGASGEEEGATNKNQGAGLHLEQAERKDPEKNATEPQEESGAGNGKNEDEIAARPKRNAVKQRKIHEPRLCKALGCECEFGLAGEAGEAAEKRAKGADGRKRGRNGTAGPKSQRQKKGDPECSEEELDLAGDVIESSDPDSDEDPVCDLPMGGTFEDKGEKIDKHMVFNYEIIAMKYLRVKYIYQVLDRQHADTRAHREKLRSSCPLEVWPLIFLGLVSRKEVIKAINSLKLDNISKSPELEDFDLPYLLKLLSEGAIEESRVYIANKKWRDDGAKLSPNEVFIS